jgi:P2 family phage contractile tail tube protein
MANQTPETVINYQIYAEGARLLGSAEITLPSLTAMSVEVKGAGIAGVVDSPVVGHYQSMTMTMTFRTVLGDINSILTPERAHHLEAWAAIQYRDPSTGQWQPKQHKVIMRAIPKNYNLGKFAVAELQDVELEFELIYCMSIFDNVTQFELDKYNGIVRIGGSNSITDAIWRAIGLI